MLPGAVGEQNADDSQTNTPFYHLFVVHHTHWDREWWATFQGLRIRLVELIDDLLDTIEREPSFRSFLIDGQTIVLRDYLEIRPENRDRLVGAIRAGRIQCGPWYLLPDEFLVSGEAHIRNFWLARRVAQSLDVPLLTIGYIPDTFGHIAQMPQILRGVGIDNAFIWRGRGGDPATVKQEFIWEAPDGSSVLTHWFPNGYYQMPFLHFGNSDRPYEDKLGRIFQSMEDSGPRATTDVLLLPYGGDHRPSDPRLAEKIAEANTAITGRGEIRWATPDEYIAAIRERNPRLDTVRGELRAFGQQTPHVLAGVLSTRLYLKELNFWGQTWLERYAEPLSALAWAAGEQYDAGLLWKAWEYLAQNHPHDSICGCSIDQVHREMLPRFAQSRQIAEIVAERAAQQINARIDTSSIDPADIALVVHNTLARPHTGWAAVWLPRQPVSPRTHKLLGPDNQDIPFQVRDTEGLRPLHEGWQWTEIGFLAIDVPALGYATYRLTRRQTALDAKQLYFSAVQATAALKGSEPVTDLSLGDNTLENRWLRVTVDTTDGTLSVTDKVTGDTYHGLNTFEDGGDAGDEYSFSAPLNDLILHSTSNARVHVSVAEAGYARATLRVDIDWALPAELTPDRLSRSSAYLDTCMATFVTLAASSRRVDITTEWENRSQDHRLRVLFPLGADALCSQAQGQFHVEQRPAAPADPGRSWPELPVSTMPQQGWVSVDDGRRGLMVANHGLPEYELLRDGRGTVALTILRAVGWCSRDDLLTRVGGAGPNVPTPDAQSLGRNQVRYAIVPHAGSWLASRAHLLAEEYLAPLYGSVTDRHAGNRPTECGLIEVSGGEHLLLSACKKAENEDALILRFWNVNEERVQARVRVIRPPRVVQLVNLLEEPVIGGELAVDEDGAFELAAGPAAIVTVAVRF
jgi:alpha-mannosidase